MMKKNVAIIGAGITGLTLAYYLKKAGVPFTVFEKNSRIGGVIHSFEQEGFVFEQGPNSGTLSNIEIVKLLDELKNDLKVQKAQAAAKRRLIWKNNRWEALPSSLMSAIKTPLFSTKDKFNILAEPFRAKGTNPNESIAEMVKRRLGKSYLDYAVDPFISGIYAGNPNYLVTKYALPKLYQLEQDYGSFIKGAIKKARLPKNEDDKRVTKEIFSVEGGLEQIVKVLANKIGAENIKLNSQNLTIAHQDHHFLIDNQKFTDVVSTVRVDYLPELLSFIPKETLKPITDLKYAPVTEVNIGFKNWQGGNLQAFGGLVPGKEQKNILGLLFMSSIFEKRAPLNGANFTLFIGGIKHPELTALSEQALLDIISKDFMQMMDLNEFKPDIIFTRTYKKAIAQYGPNSTERLKAIKTIENDHKGLILAGSIRDGVGLADRVKQATLLSQQLIYS